MFLGGVIGGFLSFMGSGTFAVGYIANNSLFPEALSSEEEKKYIQMMSKGDEEARNILIEHNLRLVAHVCKKYANSNVDQDDLISIGSIGLIKGINSYDVHKNIKLSTYISKCIDNEILMYLRSIKKLNSEVYLEDPIGKDKDDNTITLKEILENDDKPIEEEIELKLRIKKLYEKIKSSLQERERTILELRFGLNGAEPQTQHEIAKEMGISRSYVSRIETKAINKLAKEIKE
ncbi:rNA polymerase sigma factor [Clostridium sp. CAG:793]|jgi:RNA polymerase sporulation-specific sigma factor|nr:rNA polymerase sigma factor [Clostridium sp. CAG:793]